MDIQNGIQAVFPSVQGASYIDLILGYSVREAVIRSHCFSILVPNTQKPSAAGHPESLLVRDLYTVAQ